MSIQYLTAAEAALAAGNHQIARSLIEMHDADIDLIVRKIQTGDTRQ